MSCFWTDLVAATQFCETTSSGLFFGLAPGYVDPVTFDDRFGATTSTESPSAFAGAMAALVATPRVESGLLNSQVGDSPFFVKASNPSLAGFLVSTETCFAGISVYETASKTVNTPAYITPTEVLDSGSGLYVVESEDTVQSGSFSVVEAYLAFMQSSSSGQFHGIAVASLATSRFTAGIPSAGTFRIDYTGGAAPAIGAFTLYGSPDDTAADIMSTGYVVSIIRIQGSVVTGASGSIDVDCYITGFRNGNI
jgi:hypothetical protein